MLAQAYRHDLGAATDHQTDGLACALARAPAYTTGS
jgi:hypothetical protein